MAGETHVYVVQPADATASRVGDRWWISVAARVFPALATTSKAKRERKCQRLALNGDAAASTNTQVAVGDCITYTPPSAACVDVTTREPVNGHKLKHHAPLQWLAVCARQGMRLVFEDDALAVIVKPVGIHVKGRGCRTVEYALPALLSRPMSEPNQKNGVLSAPHAMHRLDYRVGGVLLVAKTRKAEIALANQFEMHRVVKRYRAILVGRLDPSKLHELSASPPAAFATAAITSSLYSSAEGDSMVYFYNAQVQGKEACSAVRIVSVTPSARYEWITTVDLWPLTGRWHQLRLHMASLGHPVVGDDLHHNTQTKVDNADLPDVVRGSGLFLHAVGVTFDDTHGNRRSFWIDEPHKFSRFRHFCSINRQKQMNRARRTRFSDRRDPDPTY